MLKTVLPGRSWPSFLNVQALPQSIYQHEFDVQNFVTEGACRLARALLFLTVPLKKAFCANLGFRNILLNGQCARGHVTDHPREHRTMMVFKRVKESRTGKPPSVHFLRKGGAWRKVVG